MNYYNTNNESGQTLKNSNAKAATQEGEILALFKSKTSLTASEAWSHYGNNTTPLTSIRRAITNLTRQGLLIKTNALKPGLYGKNEHVYSLSEKVRPEQIKPGQLEMFTLPKPKIENPT